jgi:hypothetical protein
VQQNEGLTERGLVVTPFTFVSVPASTYLEVERTINPFTQRISGLLVIFTILLNILVLLCAKDGGKILSTTFHLALKTIPAGLASIVKEIIYDKIT